MSKYYQCLPMLLNETLSGYDTGVISGALVTIGSDLGSVELSNGQKVSILQAVSVQSLTCHHHFLIGIYHFCDHVGRFIRWSYCWCSLRSDWTTACSRHSGYYIYWRSYWSSSLPYGMEHGPSRFFFFVVNYLLIIIVRNHQWLYQIGGRFLVGIGVGLAACIAPLYIQELSPTRQRGRMVVLKYTINITLSLHFV